MTAILGTKVLAIIAASAIGSVIGWFIGYFFAWREINNFVVKIEKIYPTKNDKDIEEAFLKIVDPDYN